MGVRRPAGSMSTQHVVFLLLPSPWQLNLLQAAACAQRRRAHLGDL